MNFSYNPRGYFHGVYSVQQRYIDVHLNDFDSCMKYIYIYIDTFVNCKRAEIELASIYTVY